MISDEKETQEFVSTSFVFYDSFKESIDCLEEKDRLMLYEAIASYGLHKQAPTSLTGYAKAVFVGIKAQLDANFRKRENAKKGGAPLGNKNACKNKD